MLSAALVVASVVAFSAFSGQAQAPAGGQGRGQQPPPPPPEPQAGHPSGKLVLWGDVALFNNPTDPDNCILTNRYKRGQRVGFRMTAIDGGTGEVENTATLVAHVTYAGKTVDAPMRWRGAAGPKAPPPRGYLRSPAELWTGFVDCPRRCADRENQLHGHGNGSVRPQGDVHPVLCGSVATRDRPVVE